MNILLAIPAYNCGLQISRMLLELDHVLTSTPEISKVMIIENRGQDQTLKIALEVVSTLKNKPRFEIYQNSENYGLGGSHKVAIQYAIAENHSHLMILHGDHQAFPKDIPSLISLSKTNRLTTVLGSRFSNLKKLSGYSITRTMGNLVLNSLYSIFSGKKITDLGSGLNLFNIECFLNSDFILFDDGFTFNMDLLLDLVSRDIGFLYKEIHWSTTDQISNVKAIIIGTETLKKVLLWRFFEKSWMPSSRKYETIRIQ